VPDVYVVNESTALNDTDAWSLSWALDYQSRFHFGRAGWRSDIRVSYVPGGGSAKIPAGGWILHLLDTADVQGALGYHDEDGNEVPYGRVFVKTSQSDQQQPSEVASHELLELAVDPHVNDSCLTGDGKRLYAKEVGDPCQGNGYDVGDPEGRKTGVVVADFALPEWFDPNTKATAPTTFRGSLKGPFSLGSQGYVSFIDMANSSAGWTQQVGQEHKGPIADPDDRLRRRGVSDGGTKGAKRKRVRK
jgi:hypothetical protein